MIGSGGGPLSRAGVGSIQSMRGNGEQLDRELAKRVGALLNFDFSRVRIHTNDEAASINRGLGARAFTIGFDIFFAAEAYDLNSHSGQKLVTHELVHVVQQMTGRVAPEAWGVVVRPEGDQFEEEADAISEWVVAGTNHSMRQADLERLRNPRPTGPASHVIQRSPATIVVAANTVPPAAAAPGPATCHQAALGWLLKAEGYTRPWQLLRQINATFFIPYDLSMWARDHIYNINARLDLAGLTGPHAALQPALGDILFTIQGPNVVHSMVVVRKAAGHIYIRGFNNLGTFNYLNVANPAPAGAYDGVDRDLCDPNLWNAAGTGFGAGGGMAQLKWVRYQNAATRIRNALQHWSYSFFRTPGWQHRAGGGLCHPGCPH